jgi:hypothetical protein
MSEHQNIEAAFVCDETPLTPLEGQLALLSETDLRAAISRLAVKTPLRLYFTGKMDPAGRDTEKSGGVTTALFLLAARGADEIDVGYELSQTFTGLDNADGKYGDWVVTLKHLDVDPDDLSTGEPGAAELQLAEQDEETIRAALSRLSKETRQSLYVDEGFAQDMPDKEIADGTILKGAGNAGLYLCSTLNSVLEPGETWKIDVVALTHGLTSARAWRVSVERLTQ